MKEVEHNPRVELCCKMQEVEHNPRDTNCVHTLTGNIIGVEFDVYHYYEFILQQQVLLHLDLIVVDVIKCCIISTKQINMRNWR